MNQIIAPMEPNKNKQPKKKLKKVSFFKIQFTISVIIAISVFILYLFLSYSAHKDERLAKKLINNFNISKLYANSQTNTSITQPISAIDTFVIGLIEIPSLQIIYPILSKMTDENLKISPCRFYGSMPNEIGNLCIAGHNYDNTKFFSKLHTLKKRRYHSYL